MPKTIPVYSIENFKHFSSENDFYTDSLSSHLKHHHFTTRPHKHDFYLVVLFTKGKGIHEIDFNSYPVSPGALFFLNPGQTHTWKLSKDVEGYIFFHTRNFYDEAFTNERLQNFPFFGSMHHSPLLNLKTGQTHALFLFKEILNEYQKNYAFKFRKILALTHLLYIELSGFYVPSAGIENENYTSRLYDFERLIEQNYKQMRSPGEYARQMNITERHLNRITRISLNKTPTDLILDKITLEAKRILAHTTSSIGQVAESLGYTDVSYFSRLFKKKTGQTPKEFMATYKSGNG